jgi:uncharacterized protein YvpB
LPWYFDYPTKNLNKFPLMKRIFIFILTGIMIGGFGWVLLQLTGGKTSVGIAELQSTVSMVGTQTKTPFQPQTNTPTHTVSPTYTNSPIPSETPTSTITFTPSSTPTSSSTPTPTMTPTPLKEASIEGIVGKWAAFSLDCESRSAVDWAAYFGFDINEIAFFNALPISDDPDLGFVGNVYAPWGQTPPNAYGVHAEPIAKLLQSYGVNALAHYEMTFDELRGEISSGRPVIVWVVGRVGLGTPIPYISSEGRETTVARFEHTVILIGYTQTEVTVLDGNWVYTRNIQDFKRSWSVLGNMAISWDQ